jgi:Secretion system C-terminal sorting domain
VANTYIKVWQKNKKNILNMKKNLLILSLILLSINSSVNAKYKLTPPLLCNMCTAIQTNIITNTTYQQGIYCNNNSDITINNGATLTFYRCTMQISGGSKIVVKKGGILKLDICHIFGCSSMWQGIEIEDGGAIEITASRDIASVIEDAYIAIKYNVGYGLNFVLPSYPSKLININNAIFNRNQIGIQINGQQDIVTSTEYANYLNTAFNIGNCVFTCRDIPFSNNDYYGNNYTHSVNSLKQTAASLATTFPNTPNVYTNPYINNNLFPDNNPEAYLKPPFDPSTAKSKFGIELKDVFGYTGGIPIGYVDGSSGNTQTTIFDNQDVGIHNYQSLMIVQNCTFQNPNIEQTFAPNKNNLAVGILTENNWTGTYAIFRGTQITSDIGYQKNAFFDMATAIWAKNTADIIISNNDIRSSQNITNTTAPWSYKGNWGIRVEPNGYNSIDINNNDIYNIKNGIYLNQIGIAYNNTGSVNIFNNTIRPNISAANALNNSYVQNAITLQSNQITVSKNINSNILVSGNNLSQVFNGIVSRGWINKAVGITGNTIALATDPNIATTTGYYGIRVEGGIGNNKNGSSNVIANNTVTGSSLMPLLKQAAISIANQTFTNIGCNTTSGAMYGYRFVGSCLPTQFWNNIIDPSNLYGFALTDNGQIGVVGSKTDCWLAPNTQKPSPPCYKYCTSDNDWVLPNSQMPTGHKKTYVANSTAANSPFIVNNTYANYNPDGSGGFLNSAYPPYAIVNGNITYATSNAATCSRCQLLASGPIAPPPMNVDEVQLEGVADGDIEMPMENPTDSVDILQAMQQQLYDALQNPNPQLTLTQNLQNFVQQNNWGTYDYIYYTRQFLAEGNLSYAQTMLDTWYGSTTLDINYYTYFNWLLQLHANSSYTPPLQDVWAMANLCPTANGNVVYAVRNLYNTLSNDINYFEDNCNLGNGAARAAKPSTQQNINAISKIEVYPNPSNGKFNISFNVADAGNKQFTIVDVYGKTVWQKNYGFSTGKIKVSLDTPKGVYFLLINNQKNSKQNVTKIIIN